MKKTMRNSILASAAMLLALPVLASAAVEGGILGDCVDCHTMHNSEEGKQVAQSGNGVTNTTGGAIQNLLRMDCIACHAMPDANASIMPLTGGSQVPQVVHTGATDLAGGNFANSMASERKGHNVIDLGGSDGSNADTFGAPPGKFRANTHGVKFSTDYANGDIYDAFTCAGARGCHGTRSQMLSGATVGNTTDNEYVPQHRTGISAISGAHHNSYDGAKTSDGYIAGNSAHSGQTVADGYRFIPGLKGYGNDTATADRWQNKSATSHNEYYAETAVNPVGSSCGGCHLEGAAALAGVGVSARMTLDSGIKVPGNDMSGFCSTCHGMFHSNGAENGVSGAFLRHPSDWLIPGDADLEYAAYTDWDVTAPVGRPAVAGAPDAAVHPGTDMVMCLSCHAAHATEYDFMLRFEYRDADLATQGTNDTAMRAGEYGDITTAQGMGGCLACHTTKGVLPGLRN
jgi:hypothetical protein